MGGYHKGGKGGSGYGNAKGGGGGGGWQDNAGKKGGGGGKGKGKGKPDTDYLPPQHASPALEPGQPKSVPLYPAGEASAAPKAPSFSELPAWTAAQAVRDALRRSQVICIQGETGCGKSSVMPMVFLEDPKGKIAVTQPRRIAAISLAQRVASQCHEAVGETVGYRVAMDGKVSGSTRLSFVTTGWLLMYLAHRPEALRHYTHIVLDEIHERDLDMDLLCLLLKRSLEKNPSLRLVLMSATVDATQFLDFFAGPGVRVERQPIVVGSRRFPTYPYFLDDLVNGALPGFVPRVRMDRFDKIGGRVEVNSQLFEVCVGIVQAVAKPGLCVLIFLPGLSEIEQLHEAFTGGPRRDQCPLDFHMLHSVVPHEQQKKALLPPPAGHCKVVLSTNIAESSITIPDVRYVLDFGIVRKMVFDEERAMQSLCNTWSSQATCRQRRGRCGRLQEGVIVYLFPRSHYDRLQPYASPEVLGVPLESIYLKSRVLLHHLGSPEDLLQQLIDSPPQQRIAAAAQNLRDLGALKGDGEVASLGRIAVFMPTTIQLTKLVVLSWALGIPGDGVVIAAALSTQDVFKMAAPANCRNLEDFPAHLAHNYITRARFDDGQFSEPIMYRNLYKEYLTVSKTQARAYHNWLDQSCVSVSRMSQFAALVVELAAKLGAAVPSAKAHPALQTLSRIKRSQQLKPEEVEGLFTKDYVRLKFALVGAFQPSFVQGEINTQNKNKGKINNCGFDPMRTCLLQQIKPAEMADVNNLWEFCSSLAPTKDVKLNDTGKIAFIECDDDWKVRVPASEVVHQMPLVAQLLHQLMRQPCKFKVLSDQGIWHESSKIGSPNFLNGMKWHVNGMRTMGSPYWRSNMGYMCEMRGDLKCHWGVCSSLLGREGPDQVRITGLTILPPPGSMSGTVMILAFLNGPFKVTFLGDPEGFHGVQVVASDQAEARPMVLSFAPGWWGPPDMNLLNDFRMAMDELLASPEQDTADIASQAYEDLMLAVEQQKKRWGGTKDANGFFPDADYDIRSREKQQTQARLVTPPCGCLELYEVGSQHAHPHQHARPSGFAMESQGEQATFRASPAWLRSLSALARHDLEGDLEILAAKFGLSAARLSEVRKHGLPAGLAVDIAGAAPAVEAARRELVEGILQYYGTQVEWSAAELPTEPDEEPPVRETPAKRPLAEAEEPAQEPGEEKGGGLWGDAPMATEVAWDAPVAAEEVSWGEAPGREAVPGLFQALCSVGLESEAPQIVRWAEENGAVSVHEVVENVNMLVEELYLEWDILDRLKRLR
ncbi:spn-E [Symbiodinium natans]|uniref:Spn-E protein n=1 Tax=Symbiodinium natans TaxID=878477 RepID=A0A812M9V5_9DINO|nr:spn-E [Symbiodinium natans]